MLAVGIDISKSKSTAAVLNADGTVLVSPFTFRHNQPEMNAFITYLKDQNDKTVILMESTGHYHYPVLKKFEDEGMPVCLINPYQMKKYGDTELRRAKTDKKDALKIATYALEKSYQLTPHSSMDEKHENLRILSRQYRERMLALTQNKVHLINLLDETMPGIGNVMSLKTRDPDNSLAMLFIRKYGSFDHVCAMGKTRFIDSYTRLVKKEQEGKPFNVAKIAAVNKFLRIYYAKVKAMDK